MATERIPIEVNRMVFARYQTMTYRVATIVKIEDCLTSRTARFPFKTLITLEYLADGTHASMDLSLFKSQWKSGTKPWGAVRRPLR
jgi:hypothetical protein